ncbi:MAG: hypothetical protein Q9182_005136 [Xanthomendoza sp. 2 TL-2023]
MEHLLLPREVAAPGPSAVPYVCKQPYDGGPFLTYLARQEDPDIPTIDELLISTDFAWLLRIPPSNLESFLQTWLFFGLLKEVLGDFFDPSQYVIDAKPQQQRRSLSKFLSWLSKESRLEVNTGKLLPTLRTWMKQVEHSAISPSEKQVQYKHIRDCLLTASNFLQAVAYSDRSDLNPLITSSIASLCELVELATNQLYGTDDNGYTGAWRLSYKQPQNAVQMRENGFCPYQIHRIQNLILTLSTYHYLKWMKRDVPSTRHEYCTETACLANQITLGRYVTKHRQEGCGCTDFLVDIEEVIRILSRGSLPLLHIKPGTDLNNLCVDVVEATSSLKYVALSHIWADGLGNPYANALPRCQLRFLSELIRPLLSMPEAPISDQGTYLWIDTLCCPVEPPEAKRMALSQMKVPYTGASHVLVLDSSLRDVDTSGLDPIEICIRIFTSGWMRRLWTLQEGALPENLVFQFKTTALDLRRLWLEVAKIGESDIGKRAIVLDITVLYQGLRHFFHAEKGDKSVDLESVDHALEFRSVSVLSDEPLLIGGLLELDISHILNGSMQTRMHRLWSLINSTPRGIPKNILFSRGARLRQPGFRWAPASLLTPKGGRDGNLRSRDANYKGYLTSAGLQVRLAACAIQMASAPKGLPRNPWNMSGNTDDNSIFCRDGSGSWFLIYGKYHGSQEQDPDDEQMSLRGSLRNASRSHTLLLPEAFKFDGSPEIRSGLLVHDDDELDGIPKVASDLIVEVGIKVGKTQTLLEAAFQTSRLLLADDITARYAELAIEDERTQKDHPAYATLEAQLAEKLFALAENIDDPQILEAIKTNNTRGTKTFFPVLTASAYIGDYCELGSMMPGDTEWCVD